uniref:Phosphatidic acid phosphatase type 2/haloperoxidase domain-containing protein n=1 Tax=Kalanchoe fedtschenkoi TaxID=63787 RepID=A0A7N0ZZR4_KALFE
MPSFCLTPTSTFVPRIGPKRRPVRPFRISTTPHSSRSGLSAGVLVKPGACAQIAIWGCGSGSGLMTITTAFSSCEGEKRIQVFEQEGLIDGDLELRAVDGGPEATLNRLSKWIVAAAFCAIFIWKHDAEAMWLLTGSVLNTILSIVLKQVLNQDRPVSTLKSDPGMPSSHAQSIFFVAAYLILLILAASFSTISYDQPSGRGCHLGFCILSFVVLVMGCSRTRSVHFVSLGSSMYRSWCCWILLGLSFTRDSPLAQR